MVARRAHNPEVAGSNPAPATRSHLPNGPHGSFPPPRVYGGAKRVGLVQVNLAGSLNITGLGVARTTNERQGIGMGLRAAEVADKLGVTPGRISQLVSQGKLDGCYTGEGRDRRFDLERVADALNKRLDPGQMMGNGRATKRRIAEVAKVSGQVEADAGAEDAGDDSPTKKDGRPLSPEDPDRYELAKIVQAEENARRLRRQNAVEEGRFVLASEVSRNVARAIAKEVAEVESYIRDAARRVADEMGVDFRTARKLMVDVWRAHRGTRAEAAAEAAQAARMTDEERAADI